MSLLKEDDGLLGPMLLKGPWLPRPVRNTLVPISPVISHYQDHCHCIDPIIPYKLLNSPIDLGGIETLALMTELIVD